MDRCEYQSFFVHPVEAAHRRYEALRSVFVEDRAMKEVAQRHDVSYGTIRNWVSEFCREQDAGQPSPFLLHHRAAVPRPMNSPPMMRLRKFKSPTSGSCRWKPDDD